MYFLGGSVIKASESDPYLPGFEFPLSQWVQQEE